MEFQARKYIFVLLLLFCHEVLLLEGRELKSMYRTESKQSAPTPKSQGRGFGNSGAVEGEEYFHPTTPGDSPGVDHPLEQDKDGHEIVGIKHPVMGLPTDGPGIGYYLSDQKQQSHSIDDFRPTTSGPSGPGAGHYSRAQDKEKNEQKSGNSPGAGYPDRN